MNDFDENLARKRFFIIGFTRLFGAVLLAMGLSVVANGLWDLPKFVGFIFMAIGVFDLIAMPVILSRRWKDSANK